MVGMTPWGVFFLACKLPYTKCWLLCQQAHSDQKSPAGLGAPQQAFSQGENGECYTLALIAVSCAPLYMARLCEVCFSYIHYF